MRTLVHISDIHFGRVDYDTVEPLGKAVTTIAPDLVVVSGDLTQRARTDQFIEARAFLDSLPYPKLVIPGNHDVPLLNPFSRFVGGLSKYRKHISKTLDPVYRDDEIVVAGINTARAFTIQGGRINNHQVAKLRELLCDVPERVIKVVVSHHPFDLPEAYGDAHLVGRARMAMRELAACGADLFMAGHFHLSYTGGTATRYRIDGYSAIVVQAGTATSTRGRGEPNSFNVIRIDDPMISVDRWEWRRDDRGFTLAGEDTFRRGEHGWEKR